MLDFIESVVVGFLIGVALASVAGGFMFLVGVFAAAADEAGKGWVRRGR
jgi:hypothetical protein